MKNNQHMQRTLETCRQQGRECGIVERWIPKGPDTYYGVRRDLFGFIDVIALQPSDHDLTPGLCIGIQVCAGSGHAAHKRKILTECSELAQFWLDCSCKIELWSWSKRKLKLKSGKFGKAMRWTPRIEEITLKDFRDG